MKEVFSSDGPLARHIPHYAPRAVQLHMAQAVADAIATSAELVVEAGTGTGKTYAYLAPALLSGKRVVISTGTLNLQDQLYFRDLPPVREALGARARVSLLKGRSNYLCLHRLNKARGLPALTPNWGRLQQLMDWSHTTETGEVADAGVLSAGDPLAARVTSTSDNCLGNRCPDFDACFVAKARRAAQAAEVVVVNHHLLCADLALKEEGFGRILPGADAVVIDEAHQLPEAASQFFGRRVSTRQLAEVAADSQELAAGFGDMPALAEVSAALDRLVAGVERHSAGMQGRETLERFLARSGAREALQQAQEGAQVLGAALRTYAERSPDLAACAARCTDHALLLDDLLGEGSDESVRWMEPRGQSASFHSTPIELAETFRGLRSANPGAWIFTSATLAVGEDFGHFCRELGLDSARTLRLESPFDYETQARLYLPSGLPGPNEAGYTDAVVDAALPLIEASRGGVFLLCTSHRAVKRVAARFRAEQPFPLFVHGTASRSELLQNFAAAGNGVLVGTQSFWEGVDVRGQALRVVIIDRLPFTAPGDPVFEARLDAIRKRGGNPFMDYQLPQAIMALRQGMGRLIRDTGDRGLLVLCDPRLRSKAYGSRVLQSLPAIPVLEDLLAARRWLREIGA